MDEKEGKVMKGEISMEESTEGSGSEEESEADSDYSNEAEATLADSYFGSTKQQDARGASFTSRKPKSTAINLASPISMFFFPTTL